MGVEKGFWLLLLGNVVLKRLLPRLGGADSCFGSSCTGGISLFAFDFPAAVFGILMPLIALVVPSFFLQAFLLQLKM